MNFSVSLTRIGNHCVVDSTPEEETCSSASLVIAVTPSGSITTIKKVRIPITLPTLWALDFHVSPILNSILDPGHFCTDPHPSTKNTDSDSRFLVH